MAGNVNRANQVEPEDSSSEGLALLARIIAGNILQEKGDKASKADMSDKSENEKKQWNESLPGH